ncbi:hypothetical protein GW916_09085 [bacterium]|nr:hypothetical protein [bacterium]
MKLIFSLALVFGFSFSAYSLEIFNSPRLQIDGVDHKLIDEDTFEDDWFDQTATGFCRIHGFNRVYQTSAVKGWVGPYVALNSDGEVLAQFPHEGNLDRFYELSQIICE